MTEFLSHYAPPKPELWQGREEKLANQRYYQRVKCLDLRHVDSIPTTQPALGLIGFASDAGVQRNLGRIGAQEGPDAFRTAFANLPIHHDNGVRLFDLGNIVCEDDSLEEAQHSLGELVSFCHQHHIQPIVIGGGHEVAWGHYQGIAQSSPPSSLGIINFDAHFDLRPLLANNLGSSGTPFLQIAQHRQAQDLEFHYLCIGIQKNANTPSLFATADELNVSYILAEELRDNDPETYLSRLDNFINRMDGLYLSLCLDVFAAHVAPGVSAPQVTGLPVWLVQKLIKRICDSKKILYFDIAELSPPFDRDGMTAKLAAQMGSEVISCV